MGYAFGNRPNEQSGNTSSNGGNQAAMPDPEQRNTARIVGLILALGMRLILLASIAWVVTLTSPLFYIFDH
ncbi:hypothetical protein, partial [Acinetobacter ursingii]|uniref:hypothetical protein n=1 Tax=Acinetobacter ursingii TaxID=108980 RepID=UPI0035A25545